MNIIIHPTAPKYVNAKGKTVFRYLVEGTKAELTEYKAVKGEYHRVDEGTKKPIFFSTRYAGKKANLILIEKDEKKDFIVDNTEMAMFQSLVQQYGIDTAVFMWKKDNQKVPVEKSEEESEG